VEDADVHLPGRIDVVVLVTSMGGLEALSVVLHGLPADLPVAVVIQQHLGPGSQLAPILRQRFDRDVTWARDGQFLEPGRIVVAPARRQLKVLPGGRCVVGKTGNKTLKRPFDALLTSLADSYGAGVLAAVLTGMGEDGAAGVRAVRQAGGTVIAQSEDSAEQPSMPRAAAEAGADLIVPLQEIAAAVRRMVLNPGHPAAR
jgi:chemotaxis response regulator CheB